MPLAAEAKERVGCCGSASHRLTRREAYKTGLVFTDFWDACQKVVPQEQHRATGKDDGQTCHIERFNNTLRQRLARFVRKTLSFSKTDEMHDLCLRLFLHDYNQKISLRLS